MNAHPQGAIGVLPTGGDQPERCVNPPILLSDLAVRGTLIAVVTVAPWMLGGAPARVQYWLLIAVLVALAAAIPGLLWANPPRAVPLAVVPLLLAILLGLFQLVPLPAGVLARVSPTGAAWRKDFGEQPRAASWRSVAADPAPRSDWRPVSLYPAGTRASLALLVAATAVLVLGASVFRTPKSLVWLSAALAVNGAAIAFFGLVQQLTFNGLLFWRIPLIDGSRPFGPFVNRNNAAGFLILCLAGALGWTAWALLRRAAGGGRAHAGQAFGSAGASPPRTAQQLDLAILAGLASASLILGGILCSLSRGGVLAAAGAVLATALVLLATGRRRRLWAVALVLVAGAGLVGWVGMSDSLIARMATLGNHESVTHSRLALWKDSLAAVPDFWRSGSGLGSYRYVFGPYETRASGVWFQHAENQYLESLIEAGGIGLALVLAEIALLAGAVRVLLVRGRDTEAYAFGLAGTLALAGQALQAVFDFGISIPALTLGFALVCGAVCGRALDLLPPSRRRRWLALPQHRLLAPVLAASLLVLLGLGVGEAGASSAVEQVLQRTRFSQDRPGATAAQLDRAIRQLEPTLRRRGDDVEAWRRMADLKILRYRIELLPQMQAAHPAADPGELWQLTLPAGLHARAHGLARLGRGDELEALRRERGVRENLLPALGDLVRADRACPLLPGVHLTIAQLCGLAGDPDEDAVYLDHARRLAPCNPRILFQCGLLELQAERPEQGYADWQTALGLSEDRLDDVLALAGRRISLSDMVYKVLPQSPALLVRLARRQDASARGVMLRQMLAVRAESLLAQAPLPDDQRYYLRGAVCDLEGKRAEAVEAYRRAVRLRPAEHAWRYALAVALEKESRLGEARQEAKMCALMAPRNGEYRALHRRLIRAQVSAPSPGE